MSSRLFRHTTSRKFHIAKVALAALTIAAFFLGNVSAVFADDYSNFINLFTHLKDNSAVSELKYNSLTGITPEKYVKGINFDVTLAIDTSKNDQEWHWDRIANNRETFLIQMCDKNTPDTCWLNSVGLVGDTETPEKEHSIFIQENHKYVEYEKVSVSAFDNPTVTNTTNRGSQYKYTPSTNTSSSLPNLVIRPGSTLIADLWYCAGKGSNPDEDGTNAYQNSIPPQKDGSIKLFGDLCGGTSYFKIGNSIEIQIAQDGTAIGQEVGNVSGTNAQYQASPSSSLPECGFSSIAGCLARIVYYITFKPIAWLAALFGKLFDFFIGYSVSDASYRFGFAVRGWQLVRDISNIFFILILIWTGFAAVFGFTKFSMKQIVPALIVNAIIINFSLFATRTVIDFSNIFARVFYSRIYVCNGPCVDDNHDGAYDNLKRGLGGYWPLSEKIVSSFDPQQVLQPTILQTSRSENSDINQKTVNCKEGELGASTAGDCLRANGLDAGSSEYAGYFIIVSLIAAAIMFAILKMFWGVAFMFLGRVIGLYVCMIFAPFAFLSRKIPFLEKFKELSWGKWSGNLTNYALLAPIFIFYLYIVYSFLSTKFLSDFGLQQAGGSFFESVLYIAIPMLIIYFLIDYGKKIAKEYAGEAGNMVQGWIDKNIGNTVGLVGGSALGVVAGGVATAGTRFGSRVGRWVGQKTQLGRWASTKASTNIAARWTNQALNSTQTGSWDFRRTKAFDLTKQGIQQATGKIGTPVTLTDKVSSYLGLGEKRFEGGYKGQQQRRQEKLEKTLMERIKYEYLTAEQAKKMWERVELQEAERKAVQEYAKENDSAYKKMKEDLEAAQKERADKQKEVDKVNDELKKNLYSEKDAAVKKADKEKMESRISELDKNIKEYKQKDAKLIDGLLLIARGNEWSTEDNEKNYKAKLRESYGKQKDDDLKKYGAINDTNDFADAMRRRYFEDLRNNSFWMKDGKQRAGLWTLGSLYGGSAGGPFGIIPSLAAGSFFAERLKFEQEALDAVTSKKLKEYTKTKGKTSKIGQYKADLDKIDQTIHEYIQTKSTLDLDGIKKMDIDSKKKIFQQKIDDEETSYNKANAQFKSKEKAFTTDPTDANREAFENASKTRAEAKRKYEDIKNIWSQKENLESKIDSQNK